jgi:hypothetical protein
MEARSVHFAKPIQILPERVALGLSRLVAVILTAGLIIAALALVGRRVAGGLSGPLPPVMLGATGLIAATMAALARRLAWPAGRDRFARTAIEWIPGAALAGVAAAVSLPESSPSGLGVIWVAFVGEEIWTWRQSRRRRVRRSPIEPPRANALPMPRHEVNEPLAPFTRPTEAPSPFGDVVQQFVRTQSAAGIDRIHGWLKTTLMASERNATLHVAFCPPFDESPKFTVLQTSGPAARIKPVQLLPYGVRLELKRLEPGDKVATILLEFSAESAVLPRSASARTPNPQSPAPSP